jgi:hypothetical protein
MEAQRTLIADTTLIDGADVHSHADNAPFLRAALTRRLAPEGLL